MFYKCLTVCSYHKVLPKSLCGATIISNVDHFDSHSGHAQIPPQVNIQRNNAVFRLGKAPKNIEREGSPVAGGLWHLEATCCD